VKGIVIKMIKKIYDFLLFNYMVKKIFAFIFFSQLTQNSKFYKKILEKRIKKVSKIYTEKPYCLRIENTNICNGHCTMCPREKMSRSSGIMDFELYKKIVDEAAEMKIDYINLHNFGEPLIDQNFSEKVIYAKSKGIKNVTTNSNGLLLNSKTAKKIIDSGLDKIFISVDAVSKDIYEKVRPRFNYETLIENIKNFIALRKSGNKKTPELIVNFVSIKENAHEAKRFINNWKNIADHANISFSHDWAGNQDNLRMDQIKYSYPCRLLWTELVVSWNGDYLLCCQDYDGSVVLGKVTDCSIKNIWQSKTLNAYRRRQLEVGRNGLALCENCKINTFWWF